jgi:hypothetical protein
MAYFEIITTLDPSFGWGMTAWKVLFFAPGQPFGFISCLMNMVIQFFFLFQMFIGSIFSGSYEWMDVIYPIPPFIGTSLRSCIVRTKFSISIKAFESMQDYDSGGFLSPVLDMIPDFERIVGRPHRIYAHDKIEPILSWSRDWPTLPRGGLTGRSC